MALFEEILDLPVSIIKQYIEQNRPYHYSSAGRGYTAHLLWLIGKDIELTSAKIKLAEEFLTLIEPLIQPLNLASSEIENAISIIERPLKELQVKLSLETKSVLRERLSQKKESGTYDAMLAVFSNLVQFMLERLGNLWYAINLEQQNSGSYTAKTLVYLEKTLFDLHFSWLLLEENKLNHFIPTPISQDHIEFLSKKITDIIPVLQKIRFTANLNEEEKVLLQRTLMQNIIEGLMFSFQNKHSPGVKNILTELKILKDAIAQAQDEHERRIQNEQLHATASMSALSL